MAGIDETGNKYSRLTVIKKDPDRNGYWICECKCGNSKSIYGGVLRNGSTRSCGCLLRESVSKRRKSHGLSGHPLYHIWACMVDRCHNLEAKPFPRYGGRGIKVCNEWRKDGAAFVRWGLKNGWKKGLQIDRIDNDNGYSSKNCRFVTSKVNNQNRHNTKLTSDKVKNIRNLWNTGKYTQPEIGKIYGVHRRTISDIVSHKIW